MTPDFVSQHTKAATGLSFRLQTTVPAPSTSQNTLKEEESSGNDAPRTENAYRRDHSLGISIDWPGSDPELRTAESDIN